MTLAGLPPAIQWSGISFVTTAPAATTTSFPIVMPGITFTPPPNQTLFPTLMGRAYDFYGEENPRMLEDYMNPPEQGMKFGGIGVLQTKVNS